MIQDIILDGQDIPSSRTKCTIKGAEAYIYNGALFFLVWIISYFLVFRGLQSTVIIILGDIILATILTLVYQPGK